MWARNFKAERSARILVDAVILGDHQAAQKWQVTGQTILNHRKRVEDDPDFCELFTRLLKEAEGDWRVVRLEFLRTGIAKLKELTALADSPKQIKDVAMAVKTVGELQIVSDALNDGSRNDFPGEEPEEDEGSSPEGVSVQ